MSSGGHKTSAIPRPKAASRTRTHTAKPTGRPPSRSRPTGKGQSKPAPKGKNPRATERRDDSRFADFTRPIAVEKQLIRGGGKRRVIAIGAAVITAAFVAALFVLPVQAWLRQQDDLDRKENQLAALQGANAELANEVNQLQTPEGIEQAAREEIGYVQTGEIRYTVLPVPDAPLALPGGWPYDTIKQIVAVQSAARSRP
jgi:cell division protein FtsB